MKLVAKAPGKVNLCLFVGGRRDDGRHELITLIESVSLADELELVTRAALDDEVVCPGVEEPNIVARALAGLRACGWNAPRVRVTITKRIPVAAGMGGGSADAAAVLRMAARSPGRRLGRCRSCGRARLRRAEPAHARARARDRRGRRGRAPRAARAPRVRGRAARAPAVGGIGVRGGRSSRRRPQRLEFAARLPDLWSSLAPRARLPERLLVNDLEAAARVAVPGDREPARGGARRRRGPCLRLGLGADGRRVVLGPPPAASPALRAGEAARLRWPRYPGACCAVPVPRDSVSAVCVKVGGGVVESCRAAASSVIATIGHNLIDIHD